MLFRATHKEGIEFRGAKLLDDRFAVEFNAFTV